MNHLRSASSRRAPALAVLGASLLALAAFSAAPALAKEFHAFKTSFGSAGPANGQFALAEHSGLAVNSETGDLYVADTGNNRVEEFEADGTFLTSFAVTDPTFIAVDNSAGASEGDVYVASSSREYVAKFSSAGTPLTGWAGNGRLRGFAGIAGIAVDSLGNLWVYDLQPVMREFAPDGTPTSESHPELGAAPDGIAIDSSGNLYVVRGTPFVDKLSSSGEVLGEVDSCGCATGLAVDPSGDDLYVAHSNEIVRYGATDELLESFDLPVAGTASGLALGPAHILYVTDAANQRIDVYDPEPGIPVSVSVTGPGSVSAGEGPISACTEAGGSPCEGEYLKGKTITLTAGPTERSTFAGWTGCEIESGTECTVTTSAAKSVAAEFTAIPQQTLVVADPGTGPAAGTITGTSPGAEFRAIDCGNGASSCTETYDQGVAITLTATPDERSTFAGWGAGECKSNPSPTECEVEMSATRSVTAEFAPLTQEQLAVATEGSGQGTITGSQPGGEFTPIDCVDGAETCTAEYDQGASITLTAGRAVHSKFAGWSGCPNVISTNEYAASECEVPMAAAAAVNAKFTAIPQAELEVQLEGSGEVTSSPSGIACTSGIVCTEHFDAEGPETTVTLTSTPAPDNHFKEWAGACSGEGICEVTLSAAKSVKAIFVPTLQTLTLTPSGPGSLSAAGGTIVGCEEHAGTCSDSYQEGSTVTLTASPAAHNHLTWSGCTHESGDTCEIEIGPGEASVNAAFAVNEHTLTVERTGLGSVSASSGPISACSAAGGTCSGLYPEASTLTLTAVPATHRSVEWGAGQCQSERGPDDEICEVEIGSADAVLDVTFPGNLQTLTVTPTGQGSIRATSGAINRCAEAAGTCAGEYLEASTVTLAATPGLHQAVAWQGCTAVPDPDHCEVEVGPSATAVRATFAQVTHTLSIAKAGSGQGSVSCNGAPCASTYPEGTALTLTAAPASGSTFAGWSGGGCSGTGACAVTLGADTTLTATFNANPPLPIEKQKPPPVLSCRKNFVKKHGRCVHKPKPHRHHHRKGARSPS